MSDKSNPSVSPPISIDNEQLVSLFRRAGRLMARVYHKRAHAHHAQGHVLSIIKKHGPVKQKDLLTMLDVRSSSLSEVLAKLESNDLIVRQRDEDDKRGFIISAKEGADGTPPDPNHGYQESADTLFAVLSDEERNQLGELLNKVIASVEDLEPCRQASQKPDKHDKHYYIRNKKKHHGHGRKFNRHGRR